MRLVCRRDDSLQRMESFVRESVFAELCLFDAVVVIKLIYNRASIGVIAMNKLRVPSLEVMSLVSDDVLYESRGYQPCTLRRLR